MHNKGPVQVQSTLCIRYIPGKVLCSYTGKLFYLLNSMGENHLKQNHPKLIQFLNFMVIFKFEYQIE